MSPSWVWDKLLNTCFRIHGFLGRNSKVTVAIVAIASVGLLWYIPVLFGAALIVTTIIFLIGTFSLYDSKKSLINLCIFLLVLGVIFSPVIVLTVREKYRINNPVQLINREHPKIQAMTSEFENKVVENMSTEEVLDILEDHVYQKIPYDYTFSLSLTLPTTDDIMARMTATCWGRALVGYCILKNMGYEVHVAGTFAGNHHFWLRVYEDGSYTETFLAGEHREPWVMFDELNVYWSSPFDELYRIFFDGFKVGRVYEVVEELAMLSLLFVIPIGAGAIYILVSKRNRRFVIYLAVVGGVFAVAIVSGCIGVVNARLMLLPIVVAGGLYLRVLNQKTRKLKE